MRSGSTTDTVAAEARRSARRGVFGAASLSSDSGQERLPTFLTSVLHAAPGSLGVVEGVTDALTRLSKLAGVPRYPAEARRARWWGSFASGDNLGAVIGTLAASGLVAALGVRHTILLPVVPGVLAGVAIMVAAREARRTMADAGARRTLALHLRRLRTAGLGPVLGETAESTLTRTTRSATTK